MPGSAGLRLHVVQRTVAAEELEELLPKGTRAVSVFLVNHRAPNDESPDLAYAFQAQLEIRSDFPFVPRPDLRGALAAEWDEQVADLHYADTPAYATGHGVSVDWDIEGDSCRLIRTEWIPKGEVEKTQTVDVPTAKLSMDILGSLIDGTAASEALYPLVDQYRNWIEEKRAEIKSLSGSRKETGEQLLRLLVWRPIV